MNKRGIVVFVAAAFAIQIAAQAAAIIIGYILPWTKWTITAAALIVTAWAPAAAAWIASKSSQPPEKDEGKHEIEIVPESKRSVLAAVIIVALVYAGIYGIGSKLGWFKADWEVSALTVDVRVAVEQMGLDVEQIPPPAALIGVGFVLTIVLGPTFYALVCLGSELGWRNYLLPKLLPMGRVRAYLLTNILWGAWLAPVVLARHGVGSMGWVAVLKVLAMAVVFGTVLCELWRRWRHVGLTAIWCGCFLSNASGVWQYVFQNPDAIWGGPFGLAAIIAWAIVALALIALPKRFSLE